METLIPVAAAVGHSAVAAVAVDAGVSAAFLSAALLTNLDLSVYHLGLDRRERAVQFNKMIITIANVGILPDR